MANGDNTNKVTVGFTETKQVLDLVITLCSGIAKSLEDDKISFEDLPNFFAVIYQLVPAVEGIDQVPMEFKLASAEEAEELKQYLKDNLDLPDDKMESFIEDSFGVVLDIWQLVKQYFIKTDGTIPDVSPTAPIK
jgi:hypothetical protein